MSSATAARRASETAARCPTPVASAIRGERPGGRAVLSGNRNFEGRINPRRAGELPGEPAARGRLRARRPHGHRLRRREPLGTGPDGRGRLPEGHLAERRGGAGGRSDVGRPSMFEDAVRAACSTATSAGRRSPSRGRPLRAGIDSTYVRQPPFFDGHGPRARAARRHSRRPRPGPARATRSPPTTSRPAGAIAAGLARRAATWSSTACSPKDFNSYGSRRGNHEVMMRGTFAQRPAAQPARARHRGRLDAAPARPARR